MKTKKRKTNPEIKKVTQVIKEHPSYKSLIRGVLNNIDEDEIQDVIEHGANAGFGNFVYYTDTHKFAMKYQKQIIELLEDTAEQLDMDTVSMFKNFSCVGELDKTEKKELYTYLSESKKLTAGGITNAMAWFALEEVCRWFEE